MRRFYISCIFLLLTPITSVANDYHCMQKLKNLIDARGLYLVETHMDDNKPLSLRFYDLSQGSSTVRVYGSKKGHAPGTFRGLDGRPRRVSDCQLKGNNLYVNVDNIKIEQLGERVFMAKVDSIFGTIWKSQFIQM